MNLAWPALANGVAGSVVLAAVTWVALRLAPRSALNAATRYAVWWAVLVATVALPLVHPRAEIFRPPAASEARTADPAAGLVSKGAPAPLPRIIPVEWRPIEIHRGRWMDLLGFAWAALSLVLLARLLMSFAALARRRRRAVDAPEDMQARARRWMAATGAGSRTARLAISGEIGIPVAAGPRQAAILIPARLYQELSASELEQVGLHEAAHLARRDDYALIVQRVVEAVLAWHPVVRWIARQIDLEREIACDDLAVEATGSARSYAACLTRAFSLCGGVRASLAAANAADDRAHLSRRVELLVGGVRRAGTRLRAGHVLGFAAALALLAGAVGRAPALVAFQEPRGLPAVAIPQVQKQENTEMTRRTMATAVMAIAAAAAPAAVSQEAKPAVAEQAATAAPAQTAPQTAQQARLVVYYLDLAATSNDDLAKAVDSAKKALHIILRNPPTATSSVPGSELWSRRGDSLVSIITYDGHSVRVVQDFTNDIPLLEKTLDQVQASGNSTPPSDVDRGPVLLTVMKMLGVLPEKKALVYFVTPVRNLAPANLQDVIHEAVRDNVAFFPIDTRGLAATGTGK